MTQPNWARIREGYSGEYDTARNIQVATEEICKRLDKQNKILEVSTRAFIVSHSNLGKELAKAYLEILDSL